MTGVMVSIAPWLSTPDTPSRAAAKRRVGGGEGDGVDRRWGDAGLEGVAHGGLDRTGERVDAEIRKVGGPAAGTSLDNAVGVADDGGRLGAAAVDAEVQRHGGESERVSGQAGGVCGVYI